MYTTYFYFSNLKSFSIFSIILSKTYLCNNVCFLFGDFGTGKTFFIKSFLGYLLKYKLLIKSPSFLLCDTFYFNKLIFYHFDLYKNSNHFFKANNFYDFLLDKNMYLFIEWGKSVFNKIQYDFCIYLIFYSLTNRIIILKSDYINFFDIFFRKL